MEQPITKKDIQGLFECLARIEEAQQRIVQALPEINPEINIVLNDERVRLRVKKFNDLYVSEGLRVSRER